MHHMCILCHTTPPFRDPRSFGCVIDALSRGPMSVVRMPREAKELLDWHVETQALHDAKWLTADEAHDHRQKLKRDFGMRANNRKSAALFKFHRSTQAEKDAAVFVSIWEMCVTHMTPLVHQLAIASYKSDLLWSHSQAASGDCALTTSPSPATPMAATALSACRWPRRRRASPARSPSSAAGSTAMRAACCSSLS